jgi:deoxyxylulose-5-phosphate synthase
VYKNSPAAKAGMKRGDIIIALNGNDITASNYMDLYYSSNAEFGMAVWDKAKNEIKPNGERYNLKAEEIYEDPVLLDSVYVFNGKKVGYLAYAAFDLLSANKLIEVSKKFKSGGIKELILDLRYNGGGYVSTEELLGSLPFTHQVAVTIEDGVLDGGFGEKIARFFGATEMKVLCFGADKAFTNRVPTELLRVRYKLNPQLITDKVLEVLEKKQTLVDAV